MHVCSLSQIRRVALRYLLTFAATLAPILAGAGDFDCGSEIVPSAVASTSCDFELDGTEELCGWGDYCPLATHDSGVLPTPTAAAILPPAPTASIPAASRSSLDTSVTAIATAALASAGVSVEQIVEPFAMVGPCLDNSLEMVRIVREISVWYLFCKAPEGPLRGKRYRTLFSRPFTQISVMDRDRDKQSSLENDFLEFSQFPIAPPTNERQPRKRIR